VVGERKFYRFRLTEAQAAYVGASAGMVVTADHMETHELGRVAIYVTDEWGHDVARRMHVEPGQAVEEVCGG